MTAEHTPHQPADCAIGAIPSIQRDGGGKSRGANRKVMPLPRMGCINRLPWVQATGPQALRNEKAAHYLRIFNHEAARIFDQPEMTLAKVVCNLRYFYLQSAEETVNLVRSLFNPRADYRWSQEAIRLTWEMVEGFTPSLGLADEMAKAKKRALELEREVHYLLTFTRLGGRVATKDLFSLFQEWNPEHGVSYSVSQNGSQELGVIDPPSQEWSPEIGVTDIAFGRAVVSLTGRASMSTGGVRYYSGFHLPPAEDLADAVRSAGESYLHQPSSSAPKPDREAA